MKLHSINLLGDGSHFQSPKGKISILYPSVCTFNLYEIYCLEGDLFDGPDRFDTLDEALSEITKYLGIDSKDALIDYPND